MKKILFLSISLFLFSCKGTKPYRQFNFLNGTEFFNDSLNISGRFFGDIKFKRKIKKIDRKIKKHTFLKNNHLLLQGESTISPKYNIHLFYRQKKASRMYNEDILLKLNDTINQIVIFSKTKNNKEITICLSANEKLESNLSILKDGKSIINSFRFDMSVEKELTYMKIFKKYKDECNILHIINKFDTAPIEKTKQNEWMKFQFLTTILSKDSDYHRYKSLIQKFESKKKKEISNIIQKPNFKEKLIINSNVITEIGELSEEEQVIILNEMHWKPEHRIFANMLLKPLYDNGYKYLAIEAIEKGRDSLLNNRKYPINTTGYYTRESNFGLFIRNALNLGFTIIDYDNFESGNRELYQATSIKKILDKDPKAKIFVYAGIDHILEKSNSGKTKRMAEIFKEETEINPLTINQVELISDTNNQLTLFEAKLFSKVETINSNVDYFVINNITGHILDNNELSFFSLENKKLRPYENTEVLLSVYYESEYEKYKSLSVSIKDKIVRVENNKIGLNLPLGKFYLIIYDIDNKKIISERIEVK